MKAPLVLLLVVLESVEGVLERPSTPPPPDEGVFIGLETNMVVGKKRGLLMQ